MNINLIISELFFSGSIGFPSCSKSTLYRWARKINEKLAFEKYDWKVKANIKENSIDVV